MLPMVLYTEALETTKRMQEEMKTIEEEKKELTKQLESEQGNLGVYTERQAKAAAMKADLEVQLANANTKLAECEQQRQQATQDRKSLDSGIIVIKKDIEELEMVIQRVEQEKSNRDHTTCGLNDESLQC